MILDESISLHVEIDKDDMGRDKKKTELQVHFTENEEERPRGYQLVTTTEEEELVTPPWRKKSGMSLRGAGEGCKKEGGVKLNQLRGGRLVRKYLGSERKEIIHLRGLHRTHVSRKQPAFR